MGANEEQIYLLISLNIDPYSYILVQISISFLIFLFVSLLIDLYIRITDYKNDENENIGVYHQLNELDPTTLNSDNNLGRSDGDGEKFI